jgi:nucleoside-diphosphate-sugar epimerase
MRIFLTGATGYIGEAVLEACARAGHDVTAVVRKAAKLRDTGTAQVQPLVADLAVPAAWAPALAGHDVVIHTAFESSARGPAVDRGVVDAVLDAARAARSTGRAPAIIYTSGIWVLGHTEAPAAEDAPLNPTPLVAWRPGHEQAILDAGRDGLRTAVLRPGIVYGGSRGIVGDLFRDAANGLIRIIGTGQNRWPLVHARDLADLYVRIATSPDASGVFHATDDSDERVSDIADAVAAHMTVTPDIRRVPIPEAQAKMGPYADALVLDQVVRSVRSRALGWEPASRSVTANVSRLFEEWRAGQA